MALDTTLPRTRRALLAGALGGIGAAAVTAIGRAAPVRAEGETLHVGDEYGTATSRTRILNQTNNADVLFGESAAGGIGVYGSSVFSHGVWGNSSSGTGVNGTSGTGNGVRGTSTNAGGVFGESDTSFGVGGVSGAAAGVFGAGRQGVLGRSAAGHAVRGETSGGVAVFDASALPGSQAWPPLAAGSGAWW
jgi:hypothetical protein